mgnify:FL=1
MSKIVYKIADLFAGVQKEVDQGNFVLIPHICNDIGAWGAGFVVPLGKAYPLAKERYQAAGASVMLGETIFADAGSVKVANMVAQHKLGGKAIRYEALVKCMRTVRDRVDLRYQIHAPLLGAGLAGGNWDFIEALIDEIWGAYQVTIWQLQGQELRPETGD